MPHNVGNDRAPAREARRDPSGVAWALGSIAGLGVTSQPRLGDCIPMGLPEPRIVTFVLIGLAVLSGLRKVTGSAGP
jgi:hypothetical protein